MNAGQYRGAVDGWVQGLSVKSVRGIEKVVAGWAQESNEYVCSFVLSGGGDAANGTEIGGVYIEGAKRIVEVSVARAGVRLAAWLNLVVVGKTGF